MADICCSIDRLEKFYEGDYQELCDNRLGCIINVFQHERIKQYVYSAINDFIQYLKDKTGDEYKSYFEFPEFEDHYFFNIWDIFNLCSHAKHKVNSEYTNVVRSYKKDFIYIESVYNKTDYCCGEDGDIEILYRLDLLKLLPSDLEQLIIKFREIDEENRHELHDKFEDSLSLWERECLEKQEIVKFTFFEQLRNT
jgi:hypothetical protein